MNRTKMLSFVFLVLGLLITSCSHNKFEPIKADLHHVLETSDEFENIWNITDINMHNNQQRPMIISSPSKIIVEGWDGDGILSLFTYDSLTGHLIWHTSYYSRMLGNIISHNDVIYRGTAGAAKVQAFDSINGKMIWETNLPWAHSASEIYWANGKLYIFTVDNMFFILDEQGAILDERHETFTTFLEVNNVLYSDQNFSLKAVDAETGAELWLLKIDDRFTHSPIFVDGEIFLRTWTTPGFVYSINQATGEINWKASHDVLSNLVISKDKVYFLDFDNYLIALDRYSGKEIIRVKILPQFDLKEGVHGYFIALDSTNNVLAISFGDNSQILGLKILNP